jgi:hypothetical protein
LKRRLRLRHLNEIRPIPQTDAPKSATFSTESAQCTGRRRREKLKDALIGVLRERHDPETWSGILAEAQARSEREGL